MVDARFSAVAIGNVTVELASREHGIWCDACALPSATTFTLVAHVGGTSTLRTRTVCEECGAAT